jgi:membrane protein
METFAAWNEDKIPRLGAALAYYTAFSLAPLLVIVIGVSALVFGEQAAQGRIVEQIGGLVGGKGAEAIQAMLQNAGARKSSGITATIIGLATLLFGASGVFGELQDGLNTIWGVKPRPGRGIFEMVRSRFFSFAMVLGIAFLLLVSLVVTAALSAMGKLGSTVVSEPVLQGLNLALSLGVITALFAMIFKILPDVKIAWRDVWTGAFATAVMFTLGKSAIGLYLGKSGVASAFGAAGSFVILLVWVYYSAQILYFGAEFTRIHARRQGRRMAPVSDAVPVTDEARRQQGLAPPREEHAASAPERAPAAALAPVAIAAAAAVAGFAAGRATRARLTGSAPAALDTGTKVTRALAAVERLSERKRAA